MQIVKYKNSWKVSEKVIFIFKFLNSIILRIIKHILNKAWKFLKFDLIIVSIAILGYTNLVGSEMRAHQIEIQLALGHRLTNWSSPLLVFRIVLADGVSW